MTTISREGMEGWDSGHGNASPKESRVRREGREPASGPRFRVIRVSRATMPVEAVILMSRR